MGGVCGLGEFRLTFGELDRADFSDREDLTDRADLIDLDRDPAKETVGGANKFSCCFCTIPSFIFVVFSKKKKNSSCLLCSILFY